MDLETINTVTTIGQQYLQQGLSFFGCVTSAKQLNNFFRQKAPFLHSDCKFWGNMDKFFNGGILSDDDKQKLIEKLSDVKNNDENEKRFLDLISKVDTDKKLVYILNATKALLNDEITLSIYFRICHVVINTLEEDLNFLKDHIKEIEITYSIEISGLMTTGLAYASSMKENELMNYSFTPLAKVVNDYALVGDTNLNISFDINKQSKTKFVATDEEISEMLDDVFGNK